MEFETFMSARDYAKYISVFFSERYGSNVRVLTEPLEFVYRVCDGSKNHYDCRGACLLSVTFDIMEEIKQAYSLAEKAGVKDLRIDIHVLGDFKCIPCADIPNSFKGMCYIAFVYFDKNGKEFTIIDKMEKGICVGAEMIEIGKNLW